MADHHHVEQIEVIERSVVESRRPLSEEQALNYQPISETRTTTERYTHTDAPLYTGALPPYSSSCLPPPPPFDAIDNAGASDRYYMTGEREKDTSILYNSSHSPLSPLDRSFGVASARYDTSVGGGINNYGYDLQEVQTPVSGARIVQTRGSGNIFSPENRSLADDSSFVVHDRSLDASMLHSAGNSRSLLPVSPPTLSAGVNAYHENASRGVGMRRVVETSPSQTPIDGSGVPYVSVTASGVSAPAADTSPEPLHSILKNPDRRYPSSEDNSLSRKDSYRRMQEGQDPISQHNSPFYASSATSSKVPSHQWTFASGRHNASARSDAFSDVKDFYSQLRRQFRDTEWTPRLVSTILLITLLVCLLLLVAWLVFSSVFSGYSQRNFLLYPPVCEECARRNPALAEYKTPSQLFVHLSSPVQAHFELIGNPPFKSNSFTAVDFYTGYVAIADHALTDENGRHTTCFLMELDRTALPDMSTLIDALDNTYHEVRSQFGWQEYWQFNAEQIDENVARDKFRHEIDDCSHAKWYFLRQTVYTRDSSCSSCYDFCLPDYAVLRRAKYEDEPSLGLRRLNCFRLYVPEWSRFRVETDETGGHWLYPKNQLQQQRLREQQQLVQQQQLSRQQREYVEQQQRQRDQYHLVGNWVNAGAN